MDKVEPDISQTCSDVNNRRRQGLDTDEPWFKNIKYQRYWSHRKQVTEWVKENVNTSSQHGMASEDHFGNWCKSMVEYHRNMAEWMRQMGSYYNNWHSTWLNYRNQQDLQNCFPQGMPSRRSFVHEERSQSESTATSPQLANDGSNKRKARKSSKSRKKMKIRQTLAKQINSLNLPPVTSPGEEFKMEITEEMLEFFAHSAKHKKEREAKKKDENDRKEEDEHVNLGDVNIHKSQATVQAPTERPGLRRTSEMRALYGHGAAMIHGMETAMQLTFNRNCDRQQPKPWPQLPLKITFS